MHYQIESLLNDSQDAEVIIATCKIFIENFSRSKILKMYKQAILNKLVAWKQRMISENNREAITCIEAAQEIINNN